MREVDEKLKEYYERFHEPLPLEQVPYNTEQDIINIVNDCLKKGKDAKKLKYYSDAKWYEVY